MGGGHIRTSLAAASADESIQKALDASKKYGATSVEARLAWETVEEINASLKPNAYKTKDEMDAVKAIADELKGIKLAKPTSGGIPLNVDHDIALKASLDAARTASEEFGKDSIEAKLAWETVEEVAASASDSEATRAPLDEECLIELIEGCEALEKFKDVLDGRN
ncbi:hypothetical protein THAOC_05043 [Thalassiosira oceanica]|uniref:Uncharacterized protein n=1 Tax=Thalassiosira oceanica TaxID=159749 RepID=K0T8A6_THAOC|nr:hypothetical protein THAOC_05043 [Thalassiosira oceanica]|eukprot:EJK73339.1 hypothetical protein THAOC_05043 [Thalassiosira oceanica]